MSKDGLPVPPAVEAVSVENYPTGEYIVRSCEYAYRSGGRTPNSPKNAITLPNNDIKMDHCNNKYFDIKVNLVYSSFFLIQKKEDFFSHINNSLFVCGNILIMSSQLIIELLPDCLKVILLPVCFMPQWLCPCLLDEVSICSSGTQCPLYTAA